MGVRVVSGIAIRAEVEQLLVEANKFVLLVSPYTKTTDGSGKLDLVARSLVNALHRKIRVTMVVRAEGKSNVVADHLRTLVAEGMELYAQEALHAKLYLSERKAIVTSLNLYAPTGDTTLDLGVVVPSDDSAYRDLLSFVTSKVRPGWTRLDIRTPEAKKDKAPPAKKPARPKVKISAAPSGACIRCGEEIRLNPERPYCNGCYASWARYENPNYEENFCHACGDEWDTSMRKPLCSDCFFGN